MFITANKSQAGTFSFRSCISMIISISFILTSLMPARPSYAQGVALLNLPQPGVMVGVSPVFHPAIISGLKIYPDDPLKFDFVVDTGNSGLVDQELKDESTKLIKYFLASLTIPEENLWVNLSPYEKDRIITDNFAQTQMGRDMLAQDYLLKQIMASMIYPENELGRAFWDKIYKKAYKQFGTTNIPMETFNKVWIVPESADIYQKGDMVFITDSKLKVMLEEDYLAQEWVDENNKKDKAQSKAEELNSEIIREIIIPELTHEVNNGQNFASLRQIYHSLILATWFKQNVKTSILSNQYVNQNKTDGVETSDINAKENIYNQYLEAFKLGVYNYIKEDIDPATQEVIPRKYFSGGVVLDAGSVMGQGEALSETNGLAVLEAVRINPVYGKTASSPVEEQSLKNLAIDSTEGDYEYFKRPALGRNYSDVDQTIELMVGEFDDPNAVQLLSPLSAIKKIKAVSNST